MVWNDWNITKVQSDSAQVWDINNKGTIVGSEQIERLGEVHAAKWTGTKFIDLKTLGGNFSIAKDINEKGQIVGHSYTSRPGASQEHATLWNSNGSVKDLGTLPGGFKSFAETINDKGKIIGASLVKGGGSEHAVLWNNSTSKPIDLGTLTGSGSSYAFDINNSNQIVGFLQSSHAVFGTEPPLKI